MSDIGELRATIARERERRHWTIDQDKQVYGNEWPAGVARTQAEADAAVDALAAEVVSLSERLENCNKVAQEWLERATTDSERLAACEELLRDMAQHGGVPLWKYKARIEAALAAAGSETGESSAETR